MLRSRSMQNHSAVNRAATIAEVSSRAGVSKATVSRVMNGITSKVSSATRQRVLEVVGELGYRPSRAGSTLRNGRSNVIAVLVPDPANAYHAAVATSIEQELRQQGKVMLLGNTHEDPLVQDELLREMRSMLVAGIVLLGAVASPMLAECVAAGLPVVFVNRRSPVAGRAPYVGIDNEQAGWRVARHFARRRHREIAVLHGPLTSTATRDRVEGFTAAIAALLPEATVQTCLISGDRKRSGYAIMNRILRAGNPPDALFCMTDEIAYGAGKCCLEHGFRLPDQLEIFGFDGNPLNEYVAPWLSTVSVPYRKFGSAVTEVLRQLWSPTFSGGPPDVVLSFRILLTGRS